MENLVDAYRMKLPHLTQEEKVVVGLSRADIYSTYLNQYRSFYQDLSTDFKMD
jgi:hypothetical protein